MKIQSTLLLFCFFTGVFLTGLGFIVAHSLEMVTCDNEKCTKDTNEALDFFYNVQIFGSLIVIFASSMSIIKILSEIGNLEKKIEDNEK